MLGYLEAFVGIQGSWSGGCLGHAGFMGATLQSASKFENATATFTKRPARLDDATDTFGKRLGNNRKTPQPDSESAPANARPRLSRLLDSSAVVSRFCPCETDSILQKARIRKTPQVRFRKHFSQIWQTPLKTCDHVCLVYQTLLPSFPDSACTKNLNTRKGPHSKNAAAKFGQCRSQIWKMPLKTYDHSLSRLLGLSSFVSGFCPCAKKKFNIRNSPHSENAAARFGKPAARFGTRTEKVRLRPSHFQILPGRIVVFKLFEPWETYSLQSPPNPLNPKTT